MLWDLHWTPSKRLFIAYPKIFLRQFRLAPFYMLLYCSRNCPISSLARQARSEKCYFFLKYTAVSGYVCSIHSSEESHMILKTFLNVFLASFQLVLVAFFLLNNSRVVNISFLKRINYLPIRTGVSNHVVDFFNIILPENKS